MTQTGRVLLGLFTVVLFAAADGDTSECSTRARWSAASGLWLDGASWSAGLAPTADQHIIVSSTTSFAFNGSATVSVGGGSPAVVSSLVLVGDPPPPSRAADARLAAPYASLVVSPEASLVLEPVTPCYVAARPNISLIPDIVVPAGRTSLPEAFTVSDADTPPQELFVSAIVSDGRSATRALRHGVSEPDTPPPPHPHLQPAPHARRARVRRPVLRPARAARERTCHVKGHCAGDCAGLGRLSGVADIVAGHHRGWVSPPHHGPSPHPPHPTLQTRPPSRA